MPLLRWQCSALRLWTCTWYLCGEDVIYGCCIGMYKRGPKSDPTFHAVSLSWLLRLHSQSFLVEALWSVQGLWDCLSLGAKNSIFLSLEQDHMIKSVSTWFLQPCASLVAKVLGHWGASLVPLYHSTTALFNVYLFIYLFIFTATRGGAFGFMALCLKVT